MRLITYKKGFVNIEFPYSSELVQFIKSNFIVRKFDNATKSWKVPIYLERERKALQKLVEEYGFKEWYDVEPVESSGLDIDKETVDIAIRFLHPEYSSPLLRNVIYGEAKLQKENLDIGENIFKNLFWRKEQRASVIGITPKRLNFIINEAKWDNLFLEKKLKPFLEEIEEEKELATLTDIDIELKGGNFLFPFQKAGILALAYRLRKYGGQILGDEMGLGKTIQAGALIRGRKLFPALVITPASLKYSFADKLESFFKLKSVVLNGKKPYTIPQGDVVIINYDILFEWRKRLKEFPFKILVADEAHYLKNPTAKRTRATKQLASKIPYKLLMTGTPFQNTPEELYSLLEIASLTKYVAKNKTEFNKRYVYYETLELKDRTIKRPVAGKNEEELQLKLFSRCLVRRTKDAVLKDLPPKIISKEVIEISNREEYKRYVDDEFKLEHLINFLEDRGKEIPSDIEKMSFEEAIDWLLDNYPALFAERFGYLHELVGLGKINAVVEFIEDKLSQSPQSKLIVFAYHKKVQEELFKRLKKFNPLWLKGEIGAEEKARLEKIFNEKEDNRVMVISLMAGKEGLTLTRANIAIFAELWHNPQDLKQAEDRIHRISQNETAYIYYMVGKDTIDEVIWDRITERKRSFDRAFNKTENKALIRR